MSDLKSREQILEGLRENFPPELIKQKDGGRGMKLSYVSGVDVLERLDQATNGWSDEVTWRQSRKIQMSRWDDVKQTKVPYELEVLMVEVRLTIPELGTRTGIGVQELQPNAGADVMKGAWTDAVKVAASKFGVARHLYWGDDGGSGSQGHSGAQNQNTGNYSNRGGNSPQRQAGGQQHGGGGSVQNPASDAQIRLFNMLTEKLGIDRAAVAQTIGNYPLDRLNKYGYIRVIDFLKKVESGELSWDGPSADYRNQSGQSGQTPPSHAPNTGSDSSNMDGWYKQIASAANAEKLDEISAAMEGFGLVDENVITALERRADELGIPG